MSDLTIFSIPLFIFSITLLLSIKKMFDLENKIKKVEKKINNIDFKFNKRLNELVDKKEIIENIKQRVDKLSKDNEIDVICLSSNWFDSDDLIDNTEVYDIVFDHTLNGYNYYLNSNGKAIKIKMLEIEGFYQILLK